MGKPSNREAVRKEESWSPGSKGDDEDKRAPQCLYFFYPGRQCGLWTLYSTQLVPPIACCCMYVHSCKSTSKVEAARGGKKEPAQRKGYKAIIILPIVLARHERRLRLLQTVMYRLRREERALLDEPREAGGKQELESPANDRLPRDLLGGSTWWWTLRTRCSR